MLDKPYLVFLADVREPASAKTAVGVAYWRPADCVGELAYDGCAVTTGLPRLALTEARERGARSFVFGIANAGGYFEPAWIDTMQQALAHGLDVVSGMHTRLRSIPALRDTAERHGRRLIDLREPPATLPVGTGRARAGRRLLTVGTDCSAGKMYTTLALERELRARGVDATFRATGQTGILIAGEGIPIDAVIADFIAGAAETLTPAIAADAWHLVEGQGSLFHPAFAGVSLGLLHGSAPHVMVMCHDPVRRTMRGGGDYRLPDLVECIELNERLARRVNPDAKVVGICLNTSQLDAAAAEAALTDAERRTGLPAADPVRTGVARIADAVLGA
ncbi:MAG: DUF1611 domain-containing protein [Planctomycetes bacterium]|nr:DUF1611 domain-containing protein [Planctomycetota bacterium]